MKRHNLALLACAVLLAACSAADAPASAYAASQKAAESLPGASAVASAPEASQAEKPAQAEPENEPENALKPVRYGLSVAALTEGFVDVYAAQPGPGGLRFHYTDIATGTRRALDMGTGVMSKLTGNGSLTLFAAGERVCLLADGRLTSMNPDGSDQRLIYKWRSNSPEESVYIADPYYTDGAYFYTYRNSAASSGGGYPEEDYLQPGELIQVDLEKGGVRVVAEMPPRLLVDFTTGAAIEGSIVYARHVMPRSPAEFYRGVDDWDQAGLIANDKAGIAEYVAVNLETGDERVLETFPWEGSCSMPYTLFNTGGTLYRLGPSGIGGASGEESVGLWRIRQLDGAWEPVPCPRAEGMGLVFTDEDRMLLFWQDEAEEEAPARYLVVDARTDTYEILDEELPYCLAPVAVCGGNYVLGLASPETASAPYALLDIEDFWRGEGVPVPVEDV